MNNRVWLYPEGPERVYTRLLLNLSRKTQLLLRARLNARGLLSNREDGEDGPIVRVDSWSDDLSRLILEILAEMLYPGQEAIFRLRDTFSAVSQFNDQQWRIQVKAGTGVEIGPSGTLPPGARMALGSRVDPMRLRAVFGMGVDVYRSEPWLARLQENWTAENVRLIKSIPADCMSKSEEVIRRGVMQGWSVKTLKDELRRVGKVSDAKAKLIARDQIGKANGALTKGRQEDLGVTRYKWMSSDDARVRPHHAKADGNIYTWKEGAKFKYGNHPGEEIQCRCWAKPILTDIREGSLEPNRLESSSRNSSNEYILEAS